MCLVFIKILKMLRIFKLIMRRICIQKFLLLNQLAHRAGEQTKIEFFLLYIFYALSYSTVKHVLFVKGVILDFDMSCLAGTRKGRRGNSQLHIQPMTYRAFL